MMLPPRLGATVLLLGVGLLPIAQGQIRAASKQNPTHTVPLEGMPGRSLAGCDPPPPAHSSLLMVLSVDSPVHNKFRCYHRATHSNLGILNGHMALDAGGGHSHRLRMFYVLDLKANRSAALKSEMDGAGRHDVLELPRSSTCLSKIIACLKYAAHVQLSPARGHWTRFDSMVISDDDAVIHPQRFILDMAEAAAPGLVYGQLAWVGGWDRTQQRHFGYATQAVEATGLLYGRCHAVPCPWQALIPSRELAPDPEPRPRAKLRLLRLSEHAHSDAHGPFVFPVGHYYSTTTLLLLYYCSTTNICYYTTPILLL